MTSDVLHRLADEIRKRRHVAADASYTRQLLDAGPDRCARKLGEEAIETIVAALSGDKPALKSEAADLIYHLLVVLECRAVPLADVLAELESRMGTSGLAEKARRAPKPDGKR
jgi:phosphoribosyl-ATP pyrophosphohydrolase